MESHQHPHLSNARTLGQPQPIHRDRIANEQAALLIIIWVVIFISVFAPLAIHRFHNLSR